MTDTAQCPFNGPQSLPGDSTPLRPSPTIAAWREAGAAVPLRYSDDHVGFVVTRYDAARGVLEDRRFSQQPQRTPQGPIHGHPSPDEGTGNWHVEDDDKVPGKATLDAAARHASEVSNLLGLDGASHARMRRAITSRFSVRQVRSRQEWVATTVARQLEHLRAQGSPAELTAHYAQPISALTHCHVLGVPDSRVPTFINRFVHTSTTQEKYDFIRDVLDARRGDPGEDVISDLLGSDFSIAEIEGLLHVLMTSGRDSVAYMIATATVALLSHPRQLAALRSEPHLIDGAIEEFMRTGAMFITLFPRTATEDVEIEGISIRAGQTVSVSPVGANRDPRRFDHPDDFDIERDASGHLGFGHGPHGCVGQQLARLEIREAITQLISGLPAIKLVEAEQTRPMPFANPVATYEAGSVVIAWD